MTLNDQKTADLEDSSTLIDRRTVAKGAVAAAWTVPAVSLMSAAPAFAAACSAPLTCTPTARYLNNVSPFTNVDPAYLNVTLVLTNGGPLTATGVSVTISIPKGASTYLVAPQVAVAATASDATTVTGGAVNTTLTDAGTAWTLTLGLANLAPLPATRTINLRIGFRDGGSKIMGNNTVTWADQPFRRWMGNSFTLGTNASATNAGCTATSAPALVDATPASGWTWENARVGTDGAEAGSDGVWPYWPFPAKPAAWNAEIENFWHNGRSSIGQITLQALVPKLGSGKWAATPVLNDYQSSDANSRPKWGFVSPITSENISGTNFWVFTFRSQIVAGGDASGFAPSWVSGNYDGPVDNGQSADGSKQQAFWCRIETAATGSGDSPSNCRYRLAAPRANTVIITNKNGSTT